MQFTTIAIILLVLGVLAYLAYWRLRGRDEVESIVGNWPYAQKKPMSPVEQVLYFRLREALPGCIVMLQVALSRFIEVSAGIAEWRSWHNRMNQMSIDYLVCLPDATVVAAVELDDGTHAYKKRREADAKKNLILEAAKVPLVRWQVAALPSVEEIRIRFTA